jgi:hypothetical protein
MFDEMRKVDGPAPRRGPVPTDDELRKLGNAAQMDRIHGVASHTRTEFGEIETREHGRLIVAHDRADGSLSIHGVKILTSELERGLCDAVNATSAAFNRAEAGEEQYTQKAIVGLIVSEVLRRDAALTAAVKRQLHAARFGV